MKITDFKNLIWHLPYLQQAFRIKKEVWLPEGKKEDKKEGKKMVFKYQNDRIEKVFGKENSLMISRNDLFKATNELDLFVIQVLMWGYPTKGRGNNIKKILEPERFNQTIERLNAVKQKGNITNKDVEALFSDGLGLSTVSKLLYFLQIKVESFPAMILDQRVINAISGETRFEDEDVKQFEPLKYENGITYYKNYLAFLNELSVKMNVKPDQIEMFLFEFGSNLKSAK